jgi:D-lactate dehydrogenase
MKIAFFEIEDWQRKKLLETFPDYEMLFFSGPIQASFLEQIQDIDTLVIFIYSKITPEVIDKLENLKLICTMSTGFDHIDVEYAKKKNICICNVPVYGDTSVAEHTFALILGLTRKIYQSVKRTHEGFMFTTDEELRGVNISGKVIGIVGTGSIGRKVAEIAKGFGMQILLYDLFQDVDFARKVDGSYVDIDTIYEESDFISLHLPLNNETLNIINSESISKMKDGVFIINTGRGGLIETDSLTRAIQSGKVAGAGLDVLECEQDIKEEMSVIKESHERSCVMKKVLESYELMKMDNVIITPHNAFNSIEAVNTILNKTIENIKTFEEGRPRYRL